MEFAPGFWGALLTRSGAWRARLTADAFVCDRGEVCLSFEAIGQIRCSTGFPWGTVEVETPDRTVVLRGLTRGMARRMAEALAARVAKAHLAILQPHREAILEAWALFQDFMQAPRFLAHLDLRAWASGAAAPYGSLRAALLLEGPFFLHHSAAGELKDRADVLLRALQGDASVLRDRNEDFVQREMAACGGLFDSIETMPLTPEQRRAVVVMEDRNLLVASAGSGKTSTIVGKVGYALSRELAAPEEILVLAFNASAAKEIEERIAARLQPFLSGPSTVKVKTFHALGLEIIGEVEGARPRVADFSAGKDDADARVVDDLIADLAATDTLFAEDWARFHALYAADVTDPAAFADEEAWRAHVRGSGAYENGRWGFRTLQGELVQTQSGCAIANWLWMHGVSYVSERLCPYRAGWGRRRYCRVDFYLPEIDVFLIHPMRDERGQPAPAFRADHAAMQAWRRGADRPLDIVEISFSDFLSGAAFSKLEDALTRRGAALRLMPADRILKKAPPQQQAELSGLVQTFIKHARSNRLTAEALAEAAESFYQPARARLFARIAARVLERYVEELRSRGAVDFDDMILRAADYADAGRYRHGLRLILVDEFQDISRARADLLLGLLKNAPRCKLFAVGDDWQSIYRFAGSDISLFTGFASHFGPTATNYLTKTFRSNRGIAELAADFVQKNPAQMRKTVVAEDQTHADTLVVRRVRRRGEMPDYVVSCLDEMAREASASGSRRTVFLLGRYRHLAPDQMAAWQQRYRDALTIEYKTIHSSKGLQADYVIVLGLQSGRSGFPSEIADDSLLRLVMPAPEDFPHAEERRLFYIALTRARHRAYLLGSRTSPSAFLTEVMKKNRKTSALRVADDLEAAEDAGACPQCGTGTLRLKRGKYGAFYGCSTFPACRYTQQADA